MRVVVALPDGRRFADRLRAVGGPELLVSRLSPRAPIRAITAHGASAASSPTSSIVEADVLIVPADRDCLTADLVAACDRWGTRIVARYRREADRRWAQSFGVAACPESADPAEAIHVTPTEHPAPRRGRCIAVWGAAGAPGRTTLAIELAYELARDGRRVALVDADTHAPSLALALGVADEGPGFAAACRHAARGELTLAELSRIAVPVGDVEVLAGINRPARWPELAHERVVGALESAREWVDDIVVDVSASLERDEEIVSDLDGPRRNAATLATLVTADVVVAVVAADPVGVSRFLRSYPDLRAAVGSTPVHVVVNKLRPGPLGIDARGQLRRSLSRYAGIERCWFVPWDPRATDAALLTARPIGERSARGAIPAAVRRLVGEAVSPPAPARRTRHRTPHAEQLASATASAP
ncbi:MAG: P-loop NTPase [Microbacterium arborescens]